MKERLNCTARPSDVLLRDTETAPLVGHAAQTLRRWRSEASRGAPLQGPPFIRIGRRSVRYKLHDVMTYLERCQDDTAREIGLEPRRCSDGR